MHLTENVLFYTAEGIFSVSVYEYIRKFQWFLKKQTNYMLHISSTNPFKKFPFTSNSIPSIVKDKPTILYIIKI